MPCSPNDVFINPPSGPSGPAIPGFGTPFSLPLPNVSPFPAGFPEDLLNLFNTFQFLVPPGALKPSLNPNFSKDIFDTILSMLDQFFPFLMLYKFFLPILNIIICIIEVLCSLLNPFALISAINRLFNQCIPQFLNIFPVFALIIMIISLLLLILALIEYIIAQILKIVQALLRNIAALNNAFQNGDATGVLAIAQKIGSLLCIFQNLFVLFSIFNVIIDIIKDILNIAFAIPPCQDGQSGDINSCCTPDTCPEIVKNQYTRFTGIFKYFPEIGSAPTFAGFPSGVLTFTSRNELWQLYDLQQTSNQAFRNIFDAIDITDTATKPVFFPSGTTYGVGSDLRQVPYTVNMRLFYIPQQWGRTGPSRFIRFDNCIIAVVPTTNLIEADNSVQNVSNAVALLVGGVGFEDDNVTPLPAYAADGIHSIPGPATLENFLHRPAQFYPSFVQPGITDGYTFSNVEYTFVPNIVPLIKSGLVTLGCDQTVAFSKNFISNIFASDIGLKTQLLKDLIGSQNGNIGNTFPDPNATQQCMLAAVTALRTNLTNDGVAQFQATTTQCLNALQNATSSSLNSMIGLGIDPCSSLFSLAPSVQFTSEFITVTVILNEKNGLPITNGLPPSVATNIASRLAGHLSLGTISNFTYDGYQAFTAQITSLVPGSGQISISFDNNVFCTNTFSTTAPPVHTLQSQDYQFIFAPAAQGHERRDAGDVARDGSKGGA